MRRIILLVFLSLSFGLIAQNNIYEAKQNFVKIGKHKYKIGYETFNHYEEKLRGFSEILIKGNRKQYLGSFVYQLKSDTEMRISEDHPPREQLENKIIEDSYLVFNYEKEQIIITTYYYDEKEPKEKEMKTLQQAKKGFFYLKQKETYYKNGEKKVEKDLPEKIEYMKGTSQLGL